jgi:hypothetical protein
MESKFIGKTRNWIKGYLYFLTANYLRVNYCAPYSLLDILNLFQQIIFTSCLRPFKFEPIIIQFRHKNLTKYRPNNKVI